MKFIISLYRWLPMFLLIGLLVGAIFWEEKLNVPMNEHMILGSVFLIGFGILTDQWIKQHDIDELMRRIDTYNRSSEKPNLERFYSCDIQQEDLK